VFPLPWCIVAKLTSAPVCSLCVDVTLTKRPSASSSASGSMVVGWGINLSPKLKKCLSVGSEIMSLLCVNTWPKSGFIWVLQMWQKHWNFSRGVL
jgi:hypothetical protein